MADNVKQHVAPQFHIAFFHAEGDTRVFVRKKGVSDIPLKSPKGQGYEPDAFTVMNGGARDTTCDESNKTVEDWCAPKLAGLTAGPPPTDDQWRAVFYLTANLLCRSRWTRDEHLWRMERVQRMLPKLTEVLKASPPLPEAIRHMGISAEVLDAAAELVDRAAKLLFPMTAALGSVPTAEGLKAGKDCDILIAPAGSAFITSDEPPVILDAGKAVMMEVRPGFLDRRGIEVYMPLKPDIACLWSARSGRSVREISPEEVVRYNQLVWANCYERAFASRRCDLEHL